MIVLATFILLLTIAMLFWLTSRDYAVLFADLEPRDAARIVDELEQQKLDYRLAAAGTQILVPEEDVHAVRLKLMGGGVPLSGGVGFEIFDDSDFGMTDFAQRINYQRALEGELTRTIMSLAEVRYARVHLVMPDKGLFRKEDSQPSASVTLLLKRESGFRPNDAQVIGIQRLVSAAVPNLSAANVTVSDQAGMTLSRQLPAQANVAAISGQLQQKQAVEAYLVGKLEDVLTHTYGPGEVAVSVDVTLNFREVKRTLESVVTPESGGVVRRRETRLGAGEGSAPGDNVTTEVEYQLGRTIEQIVDTPGEILHLGVGIMVPADTSQQRRDEIRGLVETVAGIDAGRGDAVAIYTMDAKNTLPAPDAELRPPEPLPTTPGSGHVNTRSATQMPPASPLFMVTMALLICLLLALLALIASRRKQRRIAAPMTSAERDEALQKLKSWLDGPVAGESL